MAKFFTTTVETVVVPVPKVPQEFMAAKVAIYTFLNIVEFFLGARFFFRLFLVGVDNGFVGFVYAVSRPFVVPFGGLLPTVLSEGVVLEWPVLIAMVVYALLAYLLVYVFRSVMVPRG